MPAAWKSASSASRRARPPPSASTARPWTKSRKSRNTADPVDSYVGRFAPSPTGPLHLGSLICAVASYLDARHQGGRWLMRMEDLDPPREPPGAAAQILEALEAHALHWDGPVLWQSSRHDAYAAVVDDLLQRGLAFRCDCSRARLKPLGNAYDGHCRERGLGPDTESAVRIRVQGDCRITVRDDIQPPLTQDLASEPGDFIIRRRDGLYAYQLAVVLDDAAQDVNRILRGSDLYDSTPRQVYLQHLLGLPTPRYAHIPVIENTRGQKLSKQTHAPPLDNKLAVANLRLALKFLRQSTPPEALRTPGELLASAADAWDPTAIPALAGIPETTLY